MIQSNFFLRYTDIEHRIRKQINAGSEIEHYSQCLMHSKSFIDKYHLEGLRFIPVLITSTREPLCDEAFREWMVQQERVPNVYFIDSTRLDSLLQIRTMKFSG